jgi:hypothetical protein
MQGKTSFPATPSLPQAKHTWRLARQLGHWKGSGEVMMACASS